MKNWIFLTFATLSVSSVCHSANLEYWTYDIANQPLSNALSLTGTTNAFGSGASFLTVDSSAALVSAPTADYSGSISDSSYAGKTDGTVAISYDMLEAFFILNAAGKAQISFGLRSGASDNCSVAFQYNANNFYLVVTDANGTQTSSPLLAAGGISITDVKIKQVYNLGDSGNAGSFRVYYSIGGGSDIEIFPATLTLHSGFSLDEFTFEVPLTGMSWKSRNTITFDNLLLDSPSPSLTFVQENISFYTNGNNGVISGDTYEPGDVLQITTTNMNNGLISVSDVTTSLYADPTMFNITPISSNTYPSIDPTETYTGIFKVEILDGATNGPNTFTVTNRINSSSAASLAFPAEFGGE